MSDLVWRSSWDKYSISQELYNGPTLDAIFFIEPAAKYLVQVPALVMNGVVVGRVLLTLFLSHLAQVGTDHDDKFNHTNSNTFKITLVSLHYLGSKNHGSKVKTCNKS